MEKENKVFWEKKKGEFFKGIANFFSNLWFDICNPKPQRVYGNEMIIWTIDEKEYKEEMVLYNEEKRKHIKNQKKFWQNKIEKAKKDKEINKKVKCGNCFC